MFDQSLNNARSLFVVLVISFVVNCTITPALGTHYVTAGDISIEPDNIIGLDVPIGRLLLNWK